MEKLNKYEQAIIAILSLVAIALIFMHFFPSHEKYAEYDVTENLY